MIQEKQCFPCPVPEPQAVSGIVRRSFIAYIANFRFCSKLFAFPAAAVLVGSLPYTLFSDVAHANRDFLSISLIWIWYLLAQIPLYYSCAVRATILQSMVLLPDEEFVTAAAFANRVWSKRCTGSVTRDIIQSVGFVALIALGCAGWYILGPYSPLFFVLAAVLSVFAFFGCFSSGFFFDCFSLSVACEEGSLSEHARRGFSLFRRSFWRGSSFQMLLFAPYLFLIVFLNPVTLYYLPQVAKIGLWQCISPSAAPIWLRLCGDLFTSAYTMISFPIMYICVANFVNDLRVRNDMPLLADEQTRSICQ